ncbi:MAG: AAA-like domain-containing protein [Caldilineaceae bacterium]
MLQFNTAGPMQADLHYMIPPLSRVDLDDILPRIAERRYFILYAPRQTGKSSCLLALRDYLNQTGQHRCLYANFEVGQSARDDVAAAMPALITQVARRQQLTFQDTFLLDQLPDIQRQNAPHVALQELLTRWAQHESLPTVLFIDEIDALVGDTLISVLRQLRAGYDQRPTAFPASLILCGVRDVRDYRIQSGSKEVITGGSAFNIKAVSLRLNDFSQAEVHALYQQHTAATGQIFEPAVFDLVWTLTRGQPWLVNALAQEACFTMKANRDRTRPITTTIIQQAKENLILRRETHLDQLVRQLHEQRVREVIEPILSGEMPVQTPGLDDIQYVVDLGLITQVPELRIANAIYQEIIPRTLSYPTQVTIHQSTSWYLLPDGRLEMNGLLTAFQQFFRENSEAWLQGFAYQEAGPQLLLQAFLQRVVNGGGQVQREYGLGRGRTDLLILWPWGEGDPQPNRQRIVIELKLQRGRLDAVLPDSLLQTWRYAEQCNADEAHLLLFDRRVRRTWRQKIYRREQSYQGRTIVVWGC